MLRYDPSMQTYYGESIDPTNGIAVANFYCAITEQGEMQFSMNVPNTIRYTNNITNVLSDMTAFTSEIFEKAVNFAVNCPEPVDDLPGMMEDEEFFEENSSEE